MKPLIKGFGFNGQLAATSMSKGAPRGLVISTPRAISVFVFGLDRFWWLHWTGTALVCPIGCALLFEHHLCCSPGCVNNPGCTGFIGSYVFLAGLWWCGATSSRFSSLPLTSTTTLNTRRWAQRRARALARQQWNLHRRGVLTLGKQGWSRSSLSWGSTIHTIRSLWRWFRKPWREEMLLRGAVEGACK